MTIRFRVAAIVAPILCVAAATANAQTIPTIPFQTNFTYWQHHWIQWMPDHPRYEAIEAAVATAPDDASRHMTRVWLTERAPPKRQVYFVDDPAAPRTLGGGPVHQRRFAIEWKGQNGGPLSLALAFDDDRGVPLAWNLAFPPDRQLTQDYAGLKPQGGHAAEAVLLLWNIGPNATTDDSVVEIGGQVFRPDSKTAPLIGPRYGAAYSAGVHGIAFVYGASTWQKEGTRLITDFGGGRTFVPVAEGWRSLPFGFARAAAIDLAVDSGGALSRYSHRFGNHVIAVNFEPGLPPIVDGGTKSGVFAIAFDDRSPAVRGMWSQSVSGGQANVSLLPSDPGWAAATRLEGALRDEGVVTSLRFGGGSR